MPDERFAEIERLYHEALERSAAERGRWLASACGDDEALRDEVGALLRYDTAGTRFLDRSALTIEAAALVRERRGGLVGRQLDGYEVLAFLGAGGMGDVYRARDVRLRREVALKVYEHASAGLLGRFEAEARTASALTHPNIVTIYGVGEAGDTAYIAMELVEGRTLRELLAEAPLPVPLVLDIAEQLADAIASAHARGIVHRDLKPENVMMTPEGRVKVLDFGIAALQHEIWAAGDQVGSEGAAPSLVGTLGYMAPEQERGAPALPASDQFSFGVICHEMLAGRRPFSGTIPGAAFDAAMAAGSGRTADDAPPTRAVDDDAVPLAGVLSRCLARDPAARYADTADLLADIRRAKARLARADTGFERGAAPLGVSRRQVLALGAMAVAGALGGAAAWRAWPRATVRHSLAVLPFGNPAQDQGSEYLCDGITESLIRQLGALPTVKVMARATAFAFKGSPLAPAAIGKQLGVGATLNGTVTRRAGRVLISAELIESSSGVRLWGNDFDRPAGDVLAVQHEIAAAILDEGLHLALGDEDRRRLTRMPVHDAAAYEQFLLAVHHLRLETEEDYLAAQDLLARAVGRAPRFALAWVTLASSYSVMTVDGYAPPADAWPQSDLNVARALAIDPDLADAHAEAAVSAFFYRWDRREAERRWKTALGLRSEVQSELLTAYALQKWASGEPQAALELARAAREVDPLNAGASVREADLLATLGRADEAAGIYERVIRDAPDDPRAYFGLAEARRRQGRFDEAIVARRRAHEAAGDDRFESLFARARGAAGYHDIVRASAREDLERMEARQEAGGYVSPLDFARASALLGDASRAFDYLAAAFDERSAGMVLLDVDPAWDDVRGDPRFAEVVKKVGIRV